MTKEKTAKRGSAQRKNEKRNDRTENNEPPTHGHKTLGFKRFAKSIARWQSPYR